MKKRYIYISCGWGCGQREWEIEIERERDRETEREGGVEWAKEIDLEIYYRFMRVKLSKAIYTDIQLYNLFTL